MVEVKIIGLVKDISLIAVTVIIMNIPCFKFFKS